MYRTVTFLLEEGKWQSSVMVERRFEDDGTALDCVITLWNAAEMLRALQAPLPTRLPKRGSSELGRQLPLF